MLNKKKMQIIFLSIFFILGVVMNNVGGSMMGYVMEGYPAWLLYGTTIMYTLFFMIVAIFTNEKPFNREALLWKNQIFYLKLAALTATNGLLFQFSAPFVSGTLAQLLTNLTIPSIFVLTLMIYPTIAFTPREIVGSVIVFAFVVFGTFYDVFSENNKNTTNSSSLEGEQDTQTDKPWWIITMIFSVLVQTGEQIAQEQAFEKKVKPWTCVFWYNLYSLPLYILTIFFESVPYLNGKTTGTTLQSAFENQKSAFECFFDIPTNESVANGECVPIYGTIWPLIFVTGYVIFFGIGAVLINEFTTHGGAFFISLISSLGASISSLVFSSPEIVGEANCDPVKWYNIMSMILITVGIYIKGPPTGKKTDRKCCRKKVSSFNKLDTPLCETSGV